MISTCHIMDVLCQPLMRGMQLKLQQNQRTIESLRAKKEKLQLRARSTVPPVIPSFSSQSSSSLKFSNI